MNQSDTESKVNQSLSLAVCFPVWNRADLFDVCFRSLLRQLEGLEASVWIFDNGSDAQTRTLIDNLKSRSHRLFKVYLPENMGIPFVANLFSGMLQDCDFVGHRTPSHILFADADIYFKRPVFDLLTILETDGNAGVISGHDSVEHELLREYSAAPGVKVKEKSIERGACLILRRELFAACVPFPHHVPDCLDWQLMLHHPRSIAAQGLKVLAVDAVVHLGLYDSTWHPVGVPASRAQVDQINHVLRTEGLFTEERKMRMENYCRHFNLPMQTCGVRGTTFQTRMPRVERETSNDGALDNDAVPELDVDQLLRQLSASQKQCTQLTDQQKLLLSRLEATEAQAAEFNVKCAMLQSERDSVRNQLSYQSRQNANLEQEVWALRASRSWRITRPLRKIASILRRI